jgi:signal transduction histidine kinase
VRELIMNVLKHANVRAAKVSLRRVDQRLEVDVEDRGVGFEPDAPTDRPARGGFGLLSVREQITRLGGSLTIETAPRQGTLVRVQVPLQADNGERRS